MAVLRRFCHLVLHDEGETELEAAGGEEEGVYAEGGGEDFVWHFGGLFRCEFRVGD